MVGVAMAEIDAPGFALVQLGDAMSAGASTVLREPSASISLRWFDPAPSTKAIVFPSGDQIGSQRTPKAVGAASCCWLVPSAFITQMPLALQYAIFVPSGDQAGLPASRLTPPRLAPVVSCVGLEPLAFITQISGFEVPFPFAT